MSIVQCVMSGSGLLFDLANIVDEYVGIDYIVKKVEKSYFECLFNFRISKDELTLLFRRSVWKQDFSSAVKALEAGASYFPIKEEIWQLAERNKIPSLHFLTAQISFERIEKIIEYDSREFLLKKYKRHSYKLPYLDPSAYSFAEAFEQSPHDNIKRILLMLYAKYNQRKDEVVPTTSEPISYSDWEIDYDDNPT